MKSRTGLIAGAALMPWLLAGAAYAGSTEVIELQGRRSATLRWQPAEGPVSGYYVVVTRNGAAPAMHSLSWDTQETIHGEYGDTIVVQTLGFDAEGAPGPISPASVAFRFVASGGGGGSSPPRDGGDRSGDGDVIGDEGGSGVPLDFTGDGYSDVLVHHGTTDLMHLLAMQGGDVERTLLLPYFPAPWAIAGTRDYDGDGTPDILWAEEGTGRLLLLPISKGAVKDDGVVEESVGAAWKVAASGDFTGDGRAEIVFWNADERLLEIRSLRGPIFMRIGRISAGSSASWGVAGACDVNGDGLDDILWETDRRIGFWQMYGNKVRRVVKLNAFAESGWAVASAGDFDADGRCDILMRHAASGRNEIWAVEGNRVAAVTELPSRPGAAQRVAGAGDYDGNGQSDVLWYDATQGTLDMWLLEDLDVAEAALPLDYLEGGVNVLVAGTPGSGPHNELTTCEGDLDGSGTVDLVDLSILKECSGRAGTGLCEAADLDGSGSVGTGDFELFRGFYAGGTCSQST